MRAADPHTPVPLDHIEAEFNDMATQVHECSTCGTSDNILVCIHCNNVGCGRCQKNHAYEHYQSLLNCSYALDLESHKIWDYENEKHVHDVIQSKVPGVSDKGNINAFLQRYDEFLSSQLEKQKLHLESMIKQHDTNIEKEIAAAFEIEVDKKTKKLRSKLSNCMKEKQQLDEKNAVLADDAKRLKNELQQVINKCQAEIGERNEKISKLTLQVQRKSAADLSKLQDLISRKEREKAKLKKGLAKRLAREETEGAADSSK